MRGCVAFLELSNGKWDQKKSEYKAEINIKSAETRYCIIEKYAIKMQASLQKR